LFHSREVATGKALSPLAERLVGIGSPPYRPVPEPGALRWQKVDFGQVYLFFIFILSGVHVLFDVDNPC